MSDPGAIIGRGMSFPPRVGPNGRIVWSAGEDNVRESIRIILLTEFGERLMTAEFGCGLAALLFEPNTPATRQTIAERIERALTVWEPRIQVDDVVVDPDPNDARSAVVTISYSLTSTRSHERLNLNVVLAG